jgi:hypothetical protein
VNWRNLRALGLVALLVAGLLAAACLHSRAPGDQQDDGGPTPFGLDCDAGLLPDGSSWTIPEFADCPCRCPDGTANAIPTSTTPVFACACALGTTDLGAGCVNDADCVLAAADCCGCANGGSSTAVLVGNLGAWLASMGSICGGPPPFADAGCSAQTRCPPSKAACDTDAGRCVVAL